MIRDWELLTFFLVSVISLISFSSFLVSCSFFLIFYSYEQIKKDRVLVNSLPKSGTHLLAKVIQIFGYHEYFTSDNYISNTPKFLGSYEIRRVLKNQKVIDNKKTKNSA